MNREIDPLMLPRIKLSRGGIPRISCVYFIIHRNKVIYVGKTKHLDIRLIYHHKLKEFGNSEVAWVKLQNRFLLKHERKWRDRLLPTLNEREWHG